MKFIFAGILFLLFLARFGETQYQPQPIGNDMTLTENEPLKKEIMQPMAMERKYL